LDDSQLALTSFTPSPQDNIVENDQALRSRTGMPYLKDVEAQHVEGGEQSPWGYDKRLEGEK
jgi:hypothetical protein